ncbi:MAG: hypothetical protein ABIX28_13835 [Vicinamibacterales bacterium]
MSYRVGFDMDGVLADFSAAFHVVEARLFPDVSELPAGEPEVEAAAQEGAPDSTVKPADNPYETRRRREAIWNEIRRTANFWTTLEPTEPGAVRRLHELMLRHRWEVFFITQRPATDGDTVQRQTQHWLVAQGFDLPSVLVIAGSRGAAAGALRLDYHVDDSPQNCLDVMAASPAQAILVASGADQKIETARKLGMAIVPSIGPALDLLDQVSEARTNPTLLKRLAAMVGWR